MHRHARTTGQPVHTIVNDDHEFVVRVYCSGQQRRYGDSVYCGVISSTVPIDRDHATEIGASEIMQYTQRKEAMHDWAGYTLTEVLDMDEDGRRWYYEVVQVYLD